VRTLKVALAQINSVPGNVESNLEKVFKFVREAKEGGAELVVFPELVLTGYNLNLIGDRVQEMATKSTTVISELEQLAKEIGISIICGLSMEKKERGIVYNSAVVIDAGSGYLGSYDKTHAFGMERYYYRLGERFPIFTICGGVKVGLMICYDAGFPEVARILAAKGAEVIICPAAWILEEQFLWESNLRSRAVDNLIPVIGVNRVGAENELTFFGGSQVVSSKGEILFQAGSEEGVSMYELDLEDYIQTRQQYKHLNDLRLAMYSSYYKEVLKE
jgi:predicted amidohydrolase